MRLAVAVFAVLVLAGCGGEPGTPATQPSDDTATTPASEPSDAMTRSKSTERELHGTVAAGVESGCLLLEARGGPYLLVGGDRDLLRPGRAVVVTGVLDPDLMTTCQQGTPFLVRTARAG